MPMDIRTYLGNRVQQARKACKLTQQELSDQTGVSIKMIQGIESGSVNPSYGILFPIVNRLGLTTSNLFSVEPDEHEEEVNRFLGKFRACNCQRRCDFVVFCRTENVDKWRVKVYSLCIIILAVFVRQA